MWAAFSSEYKFLEKIALVNSTPEKNFLRFRIPSARKGEGGGNVPRETHQKTNVSQEKDKIRKHERESEHVKSY